MYCIAVPYSPCCPKAIDHHHAPLGIIVIVLGKRGHTSELGHQGYGCPKEIDFGPYIHRRDRGSQYLSVRYTQRLAEGGIGQSVGCVGDSFD